MTPLRLSRDLPESGEFVINELLKLGLDDWFDASEASDVMIFYARITDPVVGRRVAVRLLREIVKRGLANGGTVTKMGFEVWPYQRVASALGSSWPTDRWPRLGDISLWFQLTQSGRHWLSERGLSGDEV